MECSEEDIISSDSNNFNRSHSKSDNEQMILTELYNTSPSTENLSFQHLELLKSLHNQHTNQVPANTEKTTKWAVNAYSNWRATRLARGGTTSQIPEDPGQCTISELNYWLSHFITETRQRDGKEYKHQNLYGLVCGISRHIRKTRPALNILDDPGMTNFKSTLTTVMRDLQSRQSDQPGQSQMDKLTKEQWDFLWQYGFLGEDNPSSLLHALVCLFMAIFGVGSAHELRSMTLNNFIFSKNENNKYVCITYKPNSNLLSPDSDNIPKVMIKYSEDPTAPRSFTRLLHLYVSKLPTDSQNLGLWYRPNCNYTPSENKEWYGKLPTGVHFLRTIVKTICQQAGISGNFSNYSLSPDFIDRSMCSIEHVMLSGKDLSPTQSVHTGLEFCQMLKQRKPNELKMTIPFLPTDVQALIADQEPVTIPVTPATSYNSSFNTSPMQSLASSIAMSNTSLASTIANSLSVNSANSLATTLANALNKSPQFSLEALSHQREASCSPGKEPMTISPQIIKTESMIEDRVIPSVTISKHLRTRKRSPDTSSDGDSNDGSTANPPPRKASLKESPDYGDINVEIPKDISRCMGLFKDCTIQNVTIKIYVNNKEETMSP